MIHLLLQKRTIFLLGTAKKKPITNEQGECFDSQCQQEATVMSQTQSKDLHADPPKT